VALHKDPVAWLGGASLQTPESCPPLDVLHPMASPPLKGLGQGTLTEGEGSVRLTSSLSQLVSKGKKYYQYKNELI
jgi:hypothetical protein